MPSAMCTTTGKHTRVNALAASYPILLRRGSGACCTTSGTSLTGQVWKVNRRSSVVNAVAIQQVNRDYSDSFFRSIDIQMEQMQREFSEMDRQMSRDFERMRQRAQELQQRGELIQQQDGSKIYRNEQQWEEKLSNGWRRSYHSESITYFGEPPAQPLFAPAGSQLGIGTSWPLVIVAFIVGAYAAVAAALYRNYKYTKYAASKAWLVVGLWPLLVTFSDLFRREMQSALRFASSTRGMAEAGTLRKLKIFELRKYLRANGLNISGKKDDLIQRVEEHLGKAKRR